MPESPASRRPSSPEVEAARQEILHRVESWIWSNTSTVLQRQSNPTAEHHSCPALTLGDALDQSLAAQHAASVAATEARLAGMAPDAIDDALVEIEETWNALRDASTRGDEDGLAMRRAELEATIRVCAGTWAERAIFYRGELAAQSAALRASEEGRPRYGEKYVLVSPELAAEWGSEWSQLVQIKIEREETDGRLILVLRRPTPDDLRAALSPPPSPTTTGDVQ